MPSDKIKVAGYSQKVFFGNGIEYRNFSPDLVGLQLTSDGGTPLFTMGNFSITTNVDKKKTKNFITSNFSNFITLTDLDLTLQTTLALLSNNAGVILNLDKRNLTNYALFGSFKEFVRVALENIITNWPAALYVNPLYQQSTDNITQSGYTIQNYTYDSVNDVSSFMVNTNVIVNNFEINYLTNGTLENTFNQTNNIRNLALNYQSYSILVNNNEYDILGFTGSTNILNDFLYFTVRGNAFTGLTNGYNIYHIKPNNVKENTFFNSLSDFEAYLLNRLVMPKYTALFNYTIKSDDGAILHVSDTLTWPVTDGYNIDFNSTEYETYATKLLDISSNLDLTTSNLMVRFLVTESITDFDTTTVHLSELDKDTSDQKMNKTLTVYGAEFDVINNFILGIKFANTVSYDKNDNTPDIYLKNIARVLGWDLITSVLENDLLKSYIEPKASTYSGQSVGLTAVEADTELWRRIILNTPWIWKSKGTRKAIEFIFKFIGTPLGLISFNEYIYLAENKIDIDQFRAALQLNGLNTDLSAYPISLSGYPQPLANTSDLYFQNNGLWYRETGGDNASLDITNGNNPHIGPYDGGYKYINQFRELIPNFSSVTISSQTTTTDITNLFSNYNSGTMTTYSGNTYVDIMTEDGVDFSGCYVVNTTIIEDPKHRQDMTDCGCENPQNLRSLSICIDKNSVNSQDCSSDIANIRLTQPTNLYEFDFYQYNLDGSIYTVNGQPVYYKSNFIDKTCCNFSGSIPYYYNQFSDKTLVPQYLINSGYICCQATNTCGCLVTCGWGLNKQRWTIIPSNGSKYLVFNTELGQTRVTSQDGCNCIKDYTTPIQITDPFTNEIGFGCQLTKQGVDDIDTPNSIIVKTYGQRVSGEIGCSDTSSIILNGKTFGVILNGKIDYRHKTNNLRYQSLTTPTILNNFGNTNIPLSGAPIGYMYGYNYNQFITPNFGDTVRMLVESDATIPADIFFKPELGHKLYYLVSTTEFNANDFNQQIPNMVEIPVKLNTRTGDYYGDFLYASAGTATNLYMIWDYRTKVIQSPINNYTISYTNNISAQPIRLMLGNNNSSPSTTVYYGLYNTDPITGVNANLPATNAIVVLAVQGKTILNATCNGVAGTIGDNNVTWFNVNGALKITFITQ